MRCPEKEDVVGKVTKVSDTGSNFMDVKESDDDLDELSDIVDVDLMELESNHGDPLVNGTEYTECFSIGLEITILLRVLVGNGSSYIGSDMSSNKF